MSHKDKVEKMVQEFTKKGIKRRYLAPLDYRLLWKCGIKITPPLFSPFLTLLVFNALEMFILIIPITSLAMYLFSPNKYYVFIRLLGEWFFLLVFYSIFYGLFMAIFYRTQANRMHLPLWKDYLKNESKGEAKGAVGE